MTPAQLRAREMVMTWNAIAGDDALAPLESGMFVASIERAIEAAIDDHEKAKCPWPQWVAGEFYCCHGTHTGPCQTCHADIIARHEAEALRKQVACAHEDVDDPPQCTKCGITGSWGDEPFFNHATTSAKNRLRALGAERTIPPADGFWCRHGVSKVACSHCFYDDGLQRHEPPGV